MTRSDRRWDEAAWIAAISLTIVAALFASYAAYAALHVSQQHFSAMQLWSTIFVRETAALGAVWFTASRYLHATPNDFGLTKPRLLDVAIGIMTAGVAIVTLSQLVTLMFGYDHARDWIYRALMDGTLSSRIAVLLVVGVYSPFVQEVVFRGLLLTGLTQRMRAPAAVVVSAALFGLMHAASGTAATVNAFVLGIVFGALYLRLRSLTAAIAAHVAINTASTAALMVALQHAHR